MWPLAGALLSEPPTGTTMPPFKATRCYRRAISGVNWLRSQWFILNDLRRDLQGVREDREREGREGKKQSKHLEKKEIMRKRGQRCSCVKSCHLLALIVLKKLARAALFWVKNERER